MRGSSLVALSVIVFACATQTSANRDTVLSAVLTPDSKRQGRSYYDRYDRLEDRRCGRCDDDDDDDDRRSNRPTYGSRNDRNKNYDDDDRYDDRKSKNGTDDDDGKRNDDRPRKDRHRNRYDDRERDRDRYRPDYYDRFLRDPYRSRYDDPYARRGYDRYDEGYDRYDPYPGYRRPYEERYSGYDPYGGYGPGVGRGYHDRPWDETYRGQSGWDDGGRGYYFASGRPDATSWGQRDYASSRPVQYQSSGWQNVGYNSYRDPGYTGSYDVGQGYQGVSSGYGQSSGWRNVGYTNRPYRDQSGVTQLDNRRPTDERYGQSRPTYAQSYPQSSSTTPGTSYLFQREDDRVTKIDTTDPPSTLN